jgi:hypothetical protein
MIQVKIKLIIKLSYIMCIYAFISSVINMLAYKYCNKNKVKTIQKSAIIMNILGIIFFIPFITLFTFKKDIDLLIRGSNYIYIGLINIILLLMLINFVISIDYIRICRSNIINNNDKQINNGIIVFNIISLIGSAVIVIFNNLIAF